MMKQKITTKELKNKYLNFFKQKDHEIIKSYSLLPENDPTALFISAGMHPLIPYLMGEPHPLGKRIANFQKCIRTTDIEEVGNDSHLTFIEMLGNWSFGDYFKKESIEWSFEFLTKNIGFQKEQIHITCFEGDGDAPKDEESAKIWQGLGIKNIYFLPKKDNWWGPIGETGPCGPDTEIFIDTGKKECGKECKPGCKCGKYFEIWNNVFMEYYKTKEGKYDKLKQKNVDTGMGVERTIAMLNGFKSVYDISELKNILDKIKKITNIENPDKEQLKSMRIIADHVRTSTFILGDDKGIKTSNVDQGYILRRLIRRSIRHGNLLGIKEEFLTELAKEIILTYKEDYEEIEKNKEFIFDELKKEDQRFRKTLDRGLKEFEKLLAKNKTELSGEETFLLFQSYGFPLEIVQEIAKEKNVSVDVDGFNKEYKKHQELSKMGAEKRFKGGLSDSSEQNKKLHTATHILNEALRRVLSQDIKQNGSNITQERLRFDFNFPRKLTDEEIKKIEDMVNKIIKEEIPVEKMEMTLEEAKKIGAQSEFGVKYGKKVFVYKIGDFSMEICAGPHVENTKELGHFKILKEKSSSAGVRRIKAVLE